MTPIIYCIMNNKVNKNSIIRIIIHAIVFGIIGSAIILIFKHVLIGQIILITGSVILLIGLFIPTCQKSNKYCITCDIRIFWNNYNMDFTCSFLLYCFCSCEIVINYFPKRHIKKKVPCKRNNLLGC